jgi:hypothetical protein
MVAGALASPGVIDQQSIDSRLRAAGGPTALERKIREDESVADSPGSLSVPVTIVELQVA